MTDRQHEAIKRLIVKQALRGLSGERLLEYIVDKAIQGGNKRARQLWYVEFDKVFDALPRREQEVLSYGAAT